MWALKILLAILPGADKALQELFDRGEIDDATKEWLINKSYIKEKAVWNRVLAFLWGSWYGD